MATCAHCRTRETELYVNGVPICLSCADAQGAKTTEDNLDRHTATNGNGHSATGILREDLKRSER